MLSCGIWFSAPSFWMGGGLESRCVGHVYGTDGAVHGTIRTVQRYLYQRLQLQFYVLLMMGAMDARNM